MRFTFVYHFDSVDAWQVYMTEHWHSSIVSTETIAQASDALPSGVEGEVRIPRIIRATRLRRI
jgi:hypothetical protein